MPKNIYGATALTGGGSGALDAIDGTALADNDAAVVFMLSGTVGTTYLYVLDVDSGAAESSPGIISPDTNAGNKRWILSAKVPVDEDDMTSNSALMVPSQQSVKAYVDNHLLDEDNFVSDSATLPPSQQSTKAYIASQRDIPTGAKMLFYANTAPTNWTIDNSMDDKVAFITKGSVAGGQTGGGAHSTGTWTQPNHTHTGPSHTHTGPSHAHTGPSHTHTGGQHYHTISDHTHTGPSHTHTGPNHDHIGPYHDHVMPIGIGGSPVSIGYQVQTTGAEGMIKIAEVITGSIECASFYTDNAGDEATSAGGTGATGAGGTGATGWSGVTSTWNGGTEATGAAGTGATGYDGGGATGAEGTGATGGGATAATWRPTAYCFIVCTRN